MHLTRQITLNEKPYFYIRATFFGHLFLSFPIKYLVLFKVIRKLTSKNSSRKTSVAGIKLSQMRLKHLIKKIIYNFFLCHRIAKLL